MVTITIYGETPQEVTAFIDGFNDLMNGRKNANSAAPRKVINESLNEAAETAMKLSN